MRETELTASQRRQLLDWLEGRFGTPNNQLVLTLPAAFPQWGFDPDLDGPSIRKLDFIKRELTVGRNAQWIATRGDTGEIVAWTDWKWV